MNRVVVAIAVALCLFSGSLCAQNRSVGLVLPAIPQSITSATDRANYLALHYWDNFDMSNPEVVANKETKKLFADYMSILPKANQRHDAFAALWRRSYPYRDTFYYMLYLMEQHLYEAASPMRNEEFYIEALEAIESESAIAAVDKRPVVSQLELLKRNRIGSQATDFSFIDKSGMAHRLSQYKTEYTLLLFVATGCEESKRLKSEIDDNARLKALLRRGRMTIVSITTNSEGRAWRSTATPSRWVDGWDMYQEIERMKLYDLTTKPRLYLLDRNRRVMLKNTTPLQVENFIMKR